MKLELKTSTLAVLIAGLYSVRYNINAIAIPESIYLQVAEKLEFFMQDKIWDSEKISFEEWINTHLLIYPKALLSNEEINDLQSTTLYWEIPNGNVILIISMDIGVIHE